MKYMKYSLPYPFMGICYIFLLTILLQGFVNNVYADNAFEKVSNTLLLSATDEIDFDSSVIKMPDDPLSDTAEKSDNTSSGTATSEPGSIFAPEEEGGTGGTQSAENGENSENSSSGAQPENSNSSGSNHSPAGEQSAEDSGILEKSESQSEDPEAQPDSQFTDIADIPSDQKEAIESIQEKGIVRGYDDGTFRPEILINRAEFLKIVLEGADIEVPSAEYNNCFLDVGTEWFASYVCFAQAQGWVKGYADGLFYPDRNITQSEGIKILIIVNNINIKDRDADPWYVPYFKMAMKQGIITENDQDPDRALTRGEMSLYIWRHLLPTTDIAPGHIPHSENAGDDPDEDIKYNE